MVHAVYMRGDHRAGYGHDGVYWKAVDPRTPNWFFTADTRAEVLNLWREQWRQARHA
jgi:hypothetical protein